LWHECNFDRFTLEKMDGFLKICQICIPGKFLSFVLQVFYAAVMTCVICLALTIFTFQTKIDFIMSSRARDVSVFIPLYYVLQVFYAAVITWRDSSVAVLNGITYNIMGKLWTTSFWLPMSSRDVTLVCLYLYCTLYYVLQVFYTALITWGDSSVAILNEITYNLMGKLWITSFCLPMSSRDVTLVCLYLYCTLYYVLQVFYAAVITWRDSSVVVLNEIAYNIMGKLWTTSFCLPMSSRDVTLCITGILRGCYHVRDMSRPHHLRIPNQDWLHHELTWR
jgi:hypothetical protein